MLRSLLIVSLLIPPCVGDVQADHWAILVAGSNGYGNYRHHADTCHAFHLLLASGVPEEHIITMLFDDVADDPSNPFPGTLFNKPTPGGEGGVDVYKGCKKSYTGGSVTPSNFLAILTGNASAIDCTSAASHCSGEVLNSTAKDFVFWAFFDHGGAGLVAFPAGGYLYQPELWAALDKAHEGRLFRQLVIYMEACESGSMFEGFRSDTDIYITTASDPDESSWGTYCPPEDEVNGTSIGSCLGDLYSVSWMEDAQQPGNMKESLQSNYVQVAALTNLSHVMQYGTKEWTDQPIGDFLGNGSTVTEFITPAVAFSRRALTVAPQAGSHWSAREATINSLRLRASRSPPGSPHGDTLATQLAQEERRMAIWDRAFAVPAPAKRLWAPLRTSTWPPQRWTCLKAGVNAFEQACGEVLGDYGLGFVRVIAAACEAQGDEEGAVQSTAVAACELS